MDVDPWAVVLRHSLWYLLCWSHTRQTQRVLRVDRIVGVEVRPETFTPPPDLDALRTVEDHFSQGWKYPVEVLVDATAADVSRWIPRSLGRMEPTDDGRTRISASTNEPDWYARQLAVMEAPFHVVRSPELQRSVAALGRSLIRAGRASTR